MPKYLNVLTVRNNKGTNFSLQIFRFREKLNLFQVSKGSRYRSNRHRVVSTYIYDRFKFFQIFRGRIGQGSIS